MSTSLILTFLAILSFFVSTTRSNSNDLSQLREAICVKNLQKTIFYIGFIPYDHHIDNICVSLLLPDEGYLQKESQRYCFAFNNQTIKTIDLPIYVKTGHVTLLINTYKKSPTSSSNDQSVFTQSEKYFVTETENESSFNQYHSNQKIEAPASFLHFIYPPYGSIVSNELKLNFSAVDINTQINAAIYSINVPGIASFDLPTPISEITSTNIEPASWFISMTPKFNTNIESQPLLGYTSETYLEFVLTDEEILAQRVFADDWKKSKSHQSELQSISTEYQSHKSKENLSHVHLCIWASNHLDGQKTIWLQQVKYLNDYSRTKQKHHTADTASTQFSFTWVLTTDVTDDSPGTVLHQLKRLQTGKGGVTGRVNVSVIVTPFNENPIQIADLSEDPLDGSATAESIWENDVTKLYAYISSRLRNNSYDLASLRPLWARRLLLAVARSMNDNKCDVIIYGNERGSNADVLLRDIAISQQIPSAVELLNLFLDADQVPSAVIAPSHYAKQHESITMALHAHAQYQYQQRLFSKSQTKSLSQFQTILTVIPPSVDTIKFDRYKFYPLPYYISSNSNSISNSDTTNGDDSDDNDNKLNDIDDLLYLENHDKSVIIPNKECEHINNFHRKQYKRKLQRSKRKQSQQHKNKNNDDEEDDDHEINKCINIGFIARLSGEKNPGLFIQFAALLLREYYPWARFTIVGDGLLRASLEQLAHRLDIDWAVHFVGWATSDSETLDANPTPDSSRDDESEPVSYLADTVSLQRLLAGIDIVVNPSLRGWSETFCIANIEAMSMGIPLVTFGVGGIGEYVDNETINITMTDNDLQQECVPVSSDNTKNKNENCLNNNNNNNSEFTVMTNAVLVHSATPLALARAVYHLISQPESVRVSVGQGGRDTVIAYFHVERQMSQYRAFYIDLVNQYKSFINSSVIIDDRVITE